MLDELSPKEIAKEISSTPEAVQKRWERIRKWLEPVARNLESLVDCLPEKNDRKIMDRYKSTSLIAAHIGERLQLLCFFKVPVMRLLSMRG